MIKDYKDLNGFDMVWFGVIDCNFATSLFRIVLHIDQTFAQPETSGGSCKPPLASAT